MSESDAGSVRWPVLRDYRAAVRKHLGLLLAGAGFAVLGTLFSVVGPLHRTTTAYVRGSNGRAVPVHHHQPVVPVVVWIFVGFLLVSVAQFRAFRDMWEDRKKATDELAAMQLPRIRVTAKESLGFDHEEDTCRIGVEVTNAMGDGQTGTFEPGVTSVIGTKRRVGFFVPPWSDIADSRARRIPDGKTWGVQLVDVQLVSTGKATHVRFCAGGYEREWMELDDTFDGLIVQLTITAQEYAGTSEFIVWIKFGEFGIPEARVIGKASAG